MSGFDKEMQDALRADAEKLRAMGADVADPVFLEDVSTGFPFAPEGDSTDERLLIWKPGDHDDLSTPEQVVLSRQVCVPPLTGSHHNTPTSVKALDLSRVLQHALLAGQNGVWWVDYDPTSNPAYQRIAQCLEPTSCGPKATGWRDIESAPKDGSRILVFVPPYGPFTAHNRFHEFGENQDRWHVAGLINKDAIPTHWRPLPPPPGEENNIDTIYQDAHRASVRSTIATSIKREEALRAENAHMIDALRIAGDLLLKHHQHHLDLGTVIFPATDDMPDPVEIDMTDAYSDTDLCDGTIALLKVRAALSPKKGE